MKIPVTPEQIIHVTTFKIVS